MGLLKSRNRFSNKGLGNLEVREVSPTNDAAYQNLGHIAESQIQDIEDIDEIKDENGSVQNALTSALASRQMSKLQQVSIDEINYIQQSSGKYHSIRYSGLANNNMFQYFCFPYGRIIRKLDRPFTKGPQTIPFEFLGLKQELSYNVPEFYIAEAKGKIRTENLQLWANSRSINAYNYLTDRVLDISGFERHGQLNSDFATIWQSGTPERFLRFDGVNDGLNFGNILNDDGVSDVAFEAWIKVLSADSVDIPILTKRQGLFASDVGFTFFRLATSKLLRVYYHDGTANANCQSVGTINQNTWYHVAAAVDRNGNIQIYINGVASGAAVSVAGVSTVTNALSLYTARTTSGNYGSMEMGMLRMYNFGAGGLPADIATIILNHYNAEKSYYGL